MRVKRDPLDGAAAPDALSKSQANQFSKKPLKSLTKVPRKVQTQAKLIIGGVGGVAVVHVLKEEKMPKIMY